MNFNFNIVFVQRSQEFCSNSVFDIFSLADFFYNSSVKPSCFPLLHIFGLGAYFTSQSIMSSSPHLSHRLSQQIPSKLEEHSTHILVKWCGNALSHFFFLFRTEAFLLTTPRRWPYMSASVCGPTHPCSVCCLWAPDDTRRQERTTPPTPAWRPSSQMSSAVPQTLRVSSVIIHRMMCGGKKSKYMLLLFAGFCFHLSCAVFSVGESYSLLLISSSLLHLCSDQLLLSKVIPVFSPSRTISVCGRLYKLKLLLWVNCFSWFSEWGRRMCLVSLLC